MIKAEELCKVFTRNEGKQKGKGLKRAKTKKEFYAVNHISLEVGEGEIVGVLVIKFNEFFASDDG